MSDRIASGVLVSLAAVSAVGVARVVDAVADSLPGDGRVEATVPLVVLVIVALAFRWVRRSIRRYRPPSRSLWTFGHWMLGLTLLPLMVLMIRAPFMEPTQMFFGQAMRNDLHRLLAVEDSIFSETRQFTPAPSILMSPGVKAPVITLTPDGWTASVTRDGAIATCGIYDGVTPIAPAGRPRQPACTRLPFNVAGVLTGLGVLAFGIVVAAVVAGTGKRA